LVKICVGGWRPTAARHATWRTQRGFHCSVPREGSVADFEDIMADLIKHGRTRSV